jgi:hypothetical protein
MKSVYPVLKKDCHLLVGNHLYEEEMKAFWQEGL